jgi:hypothetical protein
MFIDQSRCEFRAPAERYVGCRAHCAPLEREPSHDMCSYKHAAPPEQKQVSQLCDYPLVEGQVRNPILIRASNKLDCHLVAFEILLHRDSSLNPFRQAGPCLTSHFANE